jgi:propanediol dehydratase large subunit
MNIDKILKKLGIDLKAASELKTVKVVKLPKIEIEALRAHKEQLEAVLHELKDVKIVKASEKAIVRMIAHKLERVKRTLKAQEQFRTKS